MAVPEGLRGTGKLEVFEKALNLATYTITITANNKVFLPEYQGSLTDKINGVALAIYMDAWTANNILVRNAEDFAERRRLQEKAARNCNNLLALMQMAQKVSQNTSSLARLPSLAIIALVPAQMDFTMESGS